MSLLTIDLEFVMSISQRGVDGDTTPLCDTMLTHGDEH